ncbi:hypothetical protein SDC9_202948 [bioreactor metagenome]|uniref:Uncharacterized protein n=1 Tax=bioreactor metagenome TaxID=1076179 RepID=A0A645IVV3_9ZZZZ
MRHLLGLGIVHKPLDRTPLEQMLADDLRDVIFRHAAIERALGVDDHDGTERAEAETSGLNNLDLLVEALLFELFFEVLANGRAAAGCAAGAAAD